MRTAQSHPSHNAKLAPFESFFARDSHRRHIPRRPAIGVPRQAWNPVASLLVLTIVVASLAGWYGIIRGAIALLRHL
jgi:hypothetical protein